MPQCMATYKPILNFKHLTDAYFDHELSVWMLSCTPLFRSTFSLFFLGIQEFNVVVFRSVGRLLLYESSDIMDMQAVF